MQFLDSIFLDRYVAIPDPGAGFEFSRKIGGVAFAGYRCQMLGVSFVLTTDATVADRQVSVVFSRGATEFVACVAQVVQPASQVITYFVTPGAIASTSIVSGRVVVRMPYPLEMWGAAAVGAGWIVDSDVVNLQAGDALGTINFYERGVQT